MRLLANVLVAGAVLACGGPSPSLARLPALDSTRYRIDATFVFDLPDTGGFLINGQPVFRDSIPGQLQALFASRSPTGRAIGVWDNPKRRADINWLAQVAREADGVAFDAGLSDWPSQESGAP